MGTFILLQCWIIASSFTYIPLGFKKLVCLWEIWNWIPFSSRRCRAAGSLSAKCSLLWSTGIEPFSSSGKKDSDEEGLGVIISQVACSMLSFRIDFLCQSVPVLLLRVGWGAEAQGSPHQLVPSSAMKADCGSFEVLKAHLLKQLWKLRGFPHFQT